MPKPYRIKVDHQRSRKSWRARLANDRTFSAESSHSPDHAVQVLGLRAFYPDLPVRERNLRVDRIKITAVKDGQEYLVEHLP